MNSYTDHEFDGIAYYALVVKKKWFAIARSAQKHFPGSFEFFSTSWDEHTTCSVFFVCSSHVRMKDI